MAILELVHLIAAIVTTGAIIWKQGFRVSSLMCSFFFSADVRRVRFLFVLFFCDGNFFFLMELLCSFDRLLHVSCSIDARAFSFVTG